MNLHTIFKDKTSDDDCLWVVTNNDDLHNCEATPVGNDGLWLLCVEPSCKDNIINDLEIIEAKSNKETIVDVLKQVKGVTIPSTDRQIELFVNQYTQTN